MQVYNPHLEPEIQALNEKLCEVNLPEMTLDHLSYSSLNDLKNAIASRISQLDDVLRKLRDVKKQYSIELEHARRKLINESKPHLPN